MANLYDGIKLTMSLNNTEHFKDYDFIAWPSDDDTVNNYEDDAITINNIQIGGQNLQKNDFSGELLMIYDPNDIKDAIWNYGDDNIRFKYGKFYIQVLNKILEDGNVKYFSLKNKEITGKYDKYQSKIISGNSSYNETKSLNDQSFWKCLSYSSESVSDDIINDSDFVLVSAPIIKCMNQTKHFDYNYTFKNTSSEDSSCVQITALNLSLFGLTFDIVSKYTNNIQIVDNKDPEHPVIIEDYKDLTDEDINIINNYGHYVYKIENVKFNGSSSNIISYDIKTELNINGTLSVRLNEEGYSFCQSDFNIFKFKINDESFICVINGCQLQFTQDCNCAVPHKNDQNVNSKEIISINKYENLIVSLNDSNREYCQNSEEEFRDEHNQLIQIEPLFNFHTFCDSWNNYLMYCPVDKLTFLKQGSYQFKCYDENSNEIPGIVNILSCDSELNLYDNNILIGTGTNVNLSDFVTKRDLNELWLNRDKRIELFKQNIKVLEDTYTTWQSNGKSPELLSGDLNSTLSSELINIYNRIDSDGNISTGNKRDYNFDWNRANNFNNEEGSWGGGETPSIQYDWVDIYELVPDFKLYFDESRNYYLSRVNNSFDIENLGNIEFEQLFVTNYNFQITPICGSREHACNIRFTLNSLEEGTYNTDILFISAAGATIYENITVTVENFTGYYGNIFKVLKFSKFYIDKYYFSNYSKSNQTISRSALTRSTIDTVTKKGYLSWNFRESRVKIDNGFEYTSSITINDTSYEMEVIQNNLECKLDIKITKRQNGIIIGYIISDPIEFTLNDEGIRHFVGYNKLIFHYYNESNVFLYSDFVNYSVFFVYMNSDKNSDYTELRTISFSNVNIGVTYDYDFHTIPINKEFVLTPSGYNEYSSDCFDIVLNENKFKGIIKLKQLSYSGYNINNTYELCLELYPDLEIVNYYFNKWDQNYQVLYHRLL